MFLSEDISKDANLFLSTPPTHTHTKLNRTPCSTVCFFLFLDRDLPHFPRWLCHPSPSALWVVCSLWTGPLGWTFGWSLVIGCDSWCNGEQPCAYVIWCLHPEFTGCHEWAGPARPTGDRTKPGPSQPSRRGRPCDQLWSVPGRRARLPRERPSRKSVSDLVLLLSGYIWWPLWEGGEERGYAEGAEVTGGGDWSWEATLQKDISTWAPRCGERAPGDGLEGEQCARMLCVGGVCIAGHHLSLYVQEGVPLA